MMLKISILHESRSKAMGKLKKLYNLYFMCTLLSTRDQGSAVGSMPEVAESLTQFFPAVWKSLSPDTRSK